MGSILWSLEKTALPSRSACRWVSLMLGNHSPDQTGNRAAKNTRVGLAGQQAFQHPHALPWRRSVRRLWPCERWLHRVRTGGPPP